MAVKPTANPLRVLIVDDLPAAAVMLQKVLMRAGHDVTTAADATSGLEVARNFLPQVIISDLSLPGTMDGCGLAVAVVNDPSIARPHLIAVTGHSDEERRQAAAAAGYGHYLVKPIRIAELLSILANLNSRDAVG